MTVSKPCPDKPSRRVASNGYVLVKVGKDHHLAHKSGDAYEHRMVAEEILGRRLRQSESIHHINGDRTDNRPENLAVMPSSAHHGLAHRKKKMEWRLPDEPNPIVRCACGCGIEFEKYDSKGRPRKYALDGHAPGRTPVTRDLILNALAHYTS